MASPFYYEVPSAIGGVDIINMFSGIYPATIA